jgi:hypothetical protein
MEDSGSSILIFDLPSSILHPRSSILDFLTCRLFEAPDGVDVVRGIFEPRFHRIDG